MKEEAAPVRLGVYFLIIPTFNLLFIIFSSELDTTPINVAVHASRVFPDESEFYKQRRPKTDNKEAQTYKIQYSADFNNVDGLIKDQEEVLIVNVDSMENVNGENIEDYIESIYNYDDFGTGEERSSSVTYNGNISKDVNHFGEEWNLMENDRIDLAPDTWQDYTDQALSASTANHLQMLQEDKEHFGQQWDVMEDYIDKQASPSYVKGVIEDYNDEQVSPNYVGDVMEEYIDKQVSTNYVEVEDTQSRIIPPSNFGQEWNIMEDYVPVTASYDYSSPEVQEVEVGAALHVSDKEYEEESTNNLVQVQGWELVEEEQEEQKHQDDSKASVEVNSIIEGQQMEEYQSHNHNPHLAFNSQIVTDQENPYYNSDPTVMVHEHLADDYSTLIPNLSAEARNENIDIGLIDEVNEFHSINNNDDLGMENDNLREVDTNHINISHQTEEQDNMSRNAKVDIVSERDTTPRLTDIPELVTETITTETTTLTRDQTEAPLPTTESTDIVTHPTTVLAYTATDTVETTVGPTEVIPTLQSEPNGLPHNIDALSLVSMSSLNTEKEDSLTTPLLPFPEPLTAEQEVYSFPAGHGLRFKFRIEELNNYIPNFGFRTDE